jgi:uncharacterized protein with von Willebrand factor type A (vWA) domain
MLRYRYSQWDDTQEVFPVDEEDVMDQLSDHLLYPSDLGRALRSLMMRGLTGRSGTRTMGIQELLQELRSKRKETLDKYKLSSVMDDITKRLEQVLETERRGIERRLQEARQRLEEPTPGLPKETAADLLRRLEDLATKNRQFLDGLPQDVGGRI